MEPFYPLRALVCERCFLVQLEEFESPEHIFSRLRVLLLVLERRGWSTPRATPRRWSSASGSDAASHVVEIASNDGYLLQYFVRARHPGARHRAGGQRRQGGARRRASRRSSSSSAWRPRASWPPSRRPTCCSATTCSPTCPTSTTSSAGMKLLLAPGGVITMEFPHLHAADRGQPVGHDLPRALLLLLVHRPSRQVFAAHGLRLFDVEELPDARRLAADLSAATPTTAPAGAATPRASCSSRESASRPRPRWRPTSTSSERVARGQAPDPRVPHRAQARAASGSPATARRPRATRCSTTAASGTDFIDYTVDLNPHKQGHSCPARTSRSARRTRSARTGPTSSSSCPGTSGRDHGAARLHPRVGRPLRGAARRSSSCSREVRPRRRCRAPA